MHTKTLNYANLADIEQGENKTPHKFLDRLWEQRRQWHPTPVLLPGRCSGITQRGLLDVDRGRESVAAIG